MTNQIKNTFIVFGANTDVGKTCVSMGLARVAHIVEDSFLYIKPLQTGVEPGVLTDADRVQEFNANAAVKTLFQWRSAESPHSASLKEEYVISSSHVVTEIEKTIQNSKDTKFVLIETAGGPASPASDGNLQAEVYRTLLAPVILVGDPNLGGISTTITAYTYLLSCGYKIAALVFMEGEYGNHVAVKEKIAPNIPVFTAPNINKFANSKAWIENAQSHFLNLYGTLKNHSEKSSTEAHASIQYAKKHFWWPFTQHKNLLDVNYIDAAFGDDFYTANGKQFDANASWWTQGLGHGDIGLAHAVAYSAARYGHVLFPQNVHKPAQDVVEKILATAGKGWASRVFFSDNGSTAIEVALKMAFRYREQLSSHKCEWRVLGLLDSYHGDTIGAMDASSPNAYKQSERWYRPRGVWLKAPTVVYEQGHLKLDIDLSLSPSVSFAKMADVFASERDNSHLATVYKSFIEAQIDVHKKNIGALLIEPVVHGSAGMNLIDPLFQRVLIDFCTAEKIPVILDEVFTGLWRLGLPSAAELLNRTPDIACYAKLLTGGILPLAVTVSKEDVFSSFLGDSKAEALLHGHSYTAHPIGCAAAAYALNKFENACESPRAFDYWDEAKVFEISKKSFVKRATAIGSILAVEFKTRDSGYLSQELSEFIARGKKAGFHFRPLGNVIYFVVSPLKTKEMCSQLIDDLLKLCEATSWG